MGAILSVLMSSSRTGTATPVTLMNFCTARSLNPPRIGDDAGNRCRRGDFRTGEMRAHALALPSFEIAVCCRNHAFLRAPAIAIAARAHGASALAPEEASLLENNVEAFALRSALHAGRTRNHHGGDAGRRVLALDDAGCGAQVRYPRIGAGADEHAINLHARNRRAGLKPHVGESLLGFHARL